MPATSVTIATRRSRPPQSGQARTSSANVRFKSSAHGRYRPPIREGAVAATPGSHAAVADDFALGTTRGRSLLAEARTPTYRTVCRRGGGTAAHKRVRSESGSRSIATVPSEKAFFSAMRTSPSGPRVIRSCAIGGRRTYFSNVSRPRASAAPARVAA